MDINSYFQAFELSVRSYAGDDPLDPWDKFVHFLESRMSAEEKKGLSVVLERLVQSFLQDERYHNDVRYVTHCITCANLYSDPMEVYSYLHSRGVGTQMAALYIDWAQQCEKKGQMVQAEMVYNRALMNKAQPQDTVQEQYRFFQERTSASTPAAPSDHVRHPLQNSRMVNQNTRPRDNVQPQCKEPEAACPAPRMVSVISRSENNPVRPAGYTAPETVSMYCVKELQCEGSELSFEELRARRYFDKCRQQEEQRRLAEEQQRLWEEEEEVRKLKQLLDDLERNMSLKPAEQTDPVTPAVMEQQDSAFQQADPPVTSCSPAEPFLTAALDSRPERESVLEQPDRPSEIQSSVPQSRQEDVCVQGEADSVIMDMFQAPTLLQESMFSSSVQPEDSFEKSCRISSAPSCVKAASATPFMIYQDRDQSQSAGSDQAGNKPAVTRALMEIPVSKANETPVSTEFITDESTMWGARNVSVGPCPNHTRDFSLSAHLVSTPLHPHAPHSWDAEQSQEENAVVRGVSAAEETPYLRQPTKLSPIMEQSPAEEKPAECSMQAQGTIVGEGVSLAQQSQGLSLAQSSCSSRHPLAALSFPDHTALRAQDESLRNSSRPAWSIYQSPEKEPSLLDTAKDEDLLPTTSFHRRSSGMKPLETPDIPDMSPRAAPGLNWFQMDSSTHAAEPDLDVMMSPPPVPGAWNIYQSPEKPPKTDFLWAMSPKPIAEHALHMEEVDVLLPERSFLQRESGVEALQVLHESLLMSPKRTPAAAQEEHWSPRADWSHTASPQRPVEQHLNVMTSPPQGARTPRAPMSPMDTSRAVCVPLVPDPWDEELIVSLLSNLQPPLSSQPNLTVWSCHLPSITPKMTVQIAGESLRVDFVLGQGAFATVYQATNLMTTQKLFLKVQKPANPWEFYINCQLNKRLQPSERHLYNSIHSAHLFNNGSVLVGQLHNCGTLLNAINLYKRRSEKLMPQPLVLYFSVCILKMVELLHVAHIIHADIKPDNFLLGERFLENDCFDQENLQHGLALIDLGQSIDMTLFPEGTAFTAKCMTSGFQCVEMLSGRPWTYQTDYFGIAGTVYCMLFGTYMEVKQEGDVWRTNGVFKRNVHADLWQDFFHTLLNVSDCSAPPCLSVLRQRLHAVLQQNYNSKLRSLKNRLVVQILEEARSTRR